MDLKLFAVCLHSVPNINSKIYSRLTGHFGSPEAAWSAGETQLTAAGLAEKALSSLLSFRKSNTPEKVWEKLLKNNIECIMLEEPGYPLDLKRIYDPPPIIYVSGTLPMENLCVGIVGSRRATSYGLHVSERFAMELAGYHVTIVSGMARGIDSSAHRGALKAGGRTVAVLGSGLDVVYPPENRRLYDEIADIGAVISEFPLGVPPLPLNFPARNRIISGLSAGVVVVEAAAKSGALITADFALEQGRDVWSVPGPITSLNSVGTNELIKQGARMATSSADIIQDLGGLSSLFPSAAVFVRGQEDSLADDEQKVLDLLHAEPVHLDTLVAQTGLPVKQVSTLLTYLELRSVVRQLPGKYFVSSRGSVD